MIKKLVKVGNSWALVIDRSIMELLKWEQNREVEIVTEGKSLIITSVTKTTFDTTEHLEKLAAAREYAREALAQAERGRKAAEEKAAARRGVGARPGDADAGGARPGDSG